MKYSLAIFDLDGTILNTLDDLADSVNAALLMNGLPKRSFGEVRSFVGNGIRLLIERSVPTNTKSELTDKVFDDFKAYYKLHCTDKTSPYEGIIDLLHRLKNNGCKIAVVSNKADFAVQQLCAVFFPKLFDFAVGECEGIKRKPAPDSVFKAIEMLGADPSEAVYIGDSEVDVETAKNAKLPCICVEWGFRDRDYLASIGGELFADSAEKLAGLILGEN